MNNYQIRTPQQRVGRAFPLRASAGVILAVSIAGSAFAQAPALPGVAPAPAAPSAAAPKVAVPFPALMGDTQQKVSPPASNARMVNDGAAIDRTISSAVGQADARVQGLEIGKGPMDPPDVSGYKSELDTLTGIQRQTRLLEAKRLQAEMAAKLWATVFDPAKEKALAAAADGSASATGSNPTGASPSVASPTAVASTPSLPAPPSIISGPTSGPATPVATAAPEVVVPPLPYPKVAEIIGTSGSLKAILLVPYVGEVRATVGLSLPGGRRVVRVTASEVTVVDKKDGNVVLGFGSSVPLAPPAVITPAASAATGPAGLRPNLATPNVALPVFPPSPVFPPAPRPPVPQPTPAR